MGLNDKAGKPKKKTINVIGGFLKETVLKKGIIGTLIGIVSPLIPNITDNKNSEINGTKGKVNYLQFVISAITIGAILYLAYKGWTSEAIQGVLPTSNVQG